MKRFYIPGDFSIKQKAPLSQEQCHHIRRVLRMGPGDLVEVFNGKEAFEARIVEAGKSGGYCEILRQVSVIEGKKASFVLAPAVIKPNRMDIAVEKAVELGVDRISPFTSHRSLPAPGSEKIAHWGKIAASAASQSGRVDVPAIDAPVAFEKILGIGADLKIILWEGEKKRGVENILGKWKKASQKDEIPAVLLVVGPEGGFTGEEIEAASGAGFVTWGLGDAVLRAETASIAGLAVLRQLLD